MLFYENTYKMAFITKNTKYCLVSLLVLLLALPAAAQIATANNAQATSFYNKLNKLNVSFIFPDGFKEIKAAKAGSFPFDYAMEIPGADFEIWIRLDTKKESEKIARKRNIPADPDSLYSIMGQLEAAAFSDGNTHFTRQLPPYVLNRYSADAGRIYFLDIADSPITRHYKYALLTILQKTGIGTITGICFTNEKGPEFFKNMNKASNCMKFK